MRLLLDTHILLWALAEPDRLGPEARATIEDPENEVLFSAADARDPLPRPPLPTQPVVTDPFAYPADEDE